MLRAKHRQIFLQDMAGEDMVHASDERISWVVAPVSAYEVQSFAEKVDRVRPRFVDDAFDRREELSRAGHSFVRKKRSDRVDKLFAAARDYHIPVPWRKFILSHPASCQSASCTVSCLYSLNHYTSNSLR